MALRSVAFAFIVSYDDETTIKVQNNNMTITDSEAENNLTRSYIQACLTFIFICLQYSTLIFHQAFNFYFIENFRVIVIDNRHVITSL